METKADIRKRVLQERNKLSKQEVINKSEVICNQLLNSEEYKTAKVIYIYMDFRNEVITRQIIENAFKNGKKVALPRVEGDVINFYYIHNLNDLKTGCWGILEPETTILAEDDNALIVVPGVAFDERGYRVGYGKGYYDKFLSKHKEFTKIAFAFELQIVDHITYEEHDIAMDWIATENGKLLCQKY